MLAAKIVLLLTALARYRMSSSLVDANDSGNPAIHLISLLITLIAALLAIKNSKSRTRSSTNNMSEPSPSRAGLILANQMTDLSTQLAAAKKWVSVTECYGCYLARRAGNDPQPANTIGDVMN
jgi:hypothetical protein